MRRRPVSDSTRWAGSIVCALSLHGAVAAALLLDFGTPPPVSTALPLAAMTVEIAPMPRAPQERLTEMPPGPEQVESRMQPKPQPRPRAFDPPPQVKTTPPPDALPTKPEDEPEVEQVAAADRTTAAPSSQAPAEDALQAPLRGVSNEQATSVIQTWESRLLGHLEQHKRYPSAAQRRQQEDVVFLRFTMDRTGTVLQWNIWRSRGYASLDQEVDALIQRASPLPPPPPEMGGDTIEMIVPVEFFLRRQVAQRGRR